MTTLKSTARVLNFLQARQVPVRKVAQVQLDEHAETRMAQVKVNGQCIMLGNTWDFHPGCHGFDLPEFSTASGLASLFIQAYQASGQTVKFKHNPKWTYRN